MSLGATMSHPCAHRASLFRGRPTLWPGLLLLVALSAVFTGATYPLRPPGVIDGPAGHCTAFVPEVCACPYATSPLNTGPDRGSGFTCRGAFRRTLRLLKVLLGRGVTAAAGDATPGLGRHVQTGLASLLNISKFCWMSFTDQAVFPTAVNTGFWVRLRTGSASQFAFAGPPILGAVQAGLARSFCAIASAGSAPPFCAVAAGSAPPLCAISAGSAPPFCAAATGSAPPFCAVATGLAPPLRAVFAGSAPPFCAVPARSALHYCAVPVGLVLPFCACPEGSVPLNQKTVDVML